MSIADASMTPTGATIRWYERRIKRYYEPDLSDREQLKDEMELTVEQAIQKPEDDGDGQPNIIVHHRLEVEASQASAVMDAAVSFKFKAGTELTDEDATAFIADDGHAYVLGIVRGALADTFRSVGLAAVLVPVVPYASVADAGHAPHERKLVR